MKTEELSHYRLFEEAIQEVLEEEFPGRSRWNFDEDETWLLHQNASRRVSEKLGANLLINP